MGPRNHVLDGGQDRTNPFAATRGDKTAMQSFAKLLLHLFLILVILLASESQHKGSISPSIGVQLWLKEG